MAKKVPLKKSVPGDQWDNSLSSKTLCLSDMSVYFPVRVRTLDSQKQLMNQFPSEFMREPGLNHVLAHRDLRITYAEALESQTDGKKEEVKIQLGRGRNTNIAIELDLAASNSAYHVNGLDIKVLDM